MANAYLETRKLQQAGAPADAFAWGWIKPMIDGLEKTWARHRLHEVYPSIEAMLVDSQKLAARERALWFNILRSNPKVNGYSLTGHSDYWGFAEGVTDTFGEFLGAVTDPEQTVVMRLYCTMATTWDGLMVGIYPHHAGKFTLHAFDLLGNLGNPAADRMLLNMAAYAATDAAPVQALSANYDAELNALGIVDDTSK